MQRIVSIVRTMTSLGSLHGRNLNNQLSFLNTMQRSAENEKLLTVFTPLLNQTCGFKVKGHVRRRCKSCYIVVRDERVYNICPKFPRHKQMSMKPKPLTTYILTHATQGVTRPW